MTINNFENIINITYRKLLDRSPSGAELENIYARILSSLEDAPILEKALDAVCTSPEFKQIQATNQSFTKISDQDIFYAYKFIFGRFPESERIYEIQKRFSTVGSLVESLVASNEFKENPILKNIISVKRKPVGFSNYDSKYVSTSTAKIIVLSGCQGKTLASLIQAKTGASNVTDLFIGGGSTRRDFMSSNGKSHHELLTNFDLIFTQKLDVFDILSQDPAVAGAECNTVIELKLEHHAA